MDTSDSVSFNTARRASLLLIASFFICGCALLALPYRAVPKNELVTVGVALVYIQAAHWLHPSPLTKGQVSNVIRPLAMTGVLGRLTVRLLLSVSLMLSIVVPWVWLLVFSVSQAQARLLGPHLFLMMTQVLFEIWSYRQTVSTIVRISIPVGFVAYRLHLLIDWVQEAYNVESGAFSDKFMLFLAFANLIFWTIVLFYILLLKVCPPYFSSRTGNSTHLFKSKRSIRS